MGRRKSEVVDVSQTYPGTPLNKKTKVDLDSYTNYKKESVRYKVLARGQEQGCRVKSNRDAKLEPWSSPQNVLKRLIRIGKKTDEYLKSNPNSVSPVIFNSANLCSEVSPIPERESKVSPIAGGDHRSIESSSAVFIDLDSDTDQECTASEKSGPKAISSVFDDHVKKLCNSITPIPQSNCDSANKVVPKTVPPAFIDLSNDKDEDCNDAPGKLNDLLEESNNVGLLSGQYIFCMMNPQHATSLFLEKCHSSDISGQPNVADQVTAQFIPCAETHERDYDECERDSVKCEKDSDKCERDSEKCEKDSDKCEIDSDKCEIDSEKCEKDSDKCHDKSATANLPLNSSESQVISTQFEGVESEKDEEDELSRLWRDMDFALNLIEEQGTKNKNEVKEAACEHDFFLKDDIGLVCSLCGLVGRDIESIFDFTWGAAKRKAKRVKQILSKLDSDSAAEQNMTSIQQNEVEGEERNLVLHVQFRFKMRDHQMEAFNFLEKNILSKQPGGCVIAHAPGTGKTFLMIAFVRSFLHAFPDERVLIMAPKGMLIPWVKEFKLWKVEEIPFMNFYDNNSSSQQLSDLNEAQDANALHESNIGSQQKILQIIKDWQMKKSILFVSYAHFASLVKHETGSPVALEIRRLLLDVPGLLILDEGHTSRTTDTVILTSLMLVRTQRRILLSGTLFQNNFKELFNLIKLVRPDFMSTKREDVKDFLEPLLSNQGPNLLRMSTKKNKNRSPAEVLEQKIFVECIGQKIESEIVEERSNALHLLQKLTAPIVHWYRGHVLKDLPGLVDLTVVLHLTPAQETAFANLKKHTAMQTSCKERQSALYKERQSALINVHPCLVRSPVGCEEDSSVSIFTEDPSHGAKSKFTLDLVSLCSHLQEKVLIFSQYLLPLTLLQDLFHRLWGWSDNREILRLDGDITNNECRDQIINQFNNSRESRVMLASIKACGEGVCLIGASRVVFLDINWNPAITQQAISRAFRIGQKKKVYAYHLVGSGTLDEEIQRVASKKEWLANVISGSHTEKYSYEVDPQQEDELFERVELRKMVKRCYRNLLTGDS